ncbi:hypothetical protein LXA43DRAFT_1032068, partial [Ganoderma leucocontextum]
MNAYPATPWSNGQTPSEGLTGTEVANAKLGGEPADGGIRFLACSRRDPLFGREEVRTRPGPRSRSFRCGEGSPVFVYTYIRSDVTAAAAVLLRKTRVMATPCPRLRVLTSKAVRPSISKLAPPPPPLYVHVRRALTSAALPPRFLPFFHFHLRPSSPSPLAGTGLPSSAPSPSPATAPYALGFGLPPLSESFRVPHLEEL